MAYGVLIIEDEATLAGNIRSFLARSGYEAKVAASAEEGLVQIETFKPEVVIVDFHLPDINGIEAIGRLRSVDPQLKIIMITGHSSVEVAVEAMKAGAYDFLSKPISLSKLKLLLDKVVGEDKQAEVLSYYRSRDARESGLNKLLGESPPMQQLRNSIRQLLAAEENLRDSEPPAVLVTGETGSGKEVVARALHFSGPRQKQPFVEINCASIPSQLLESELFGHERGAFTNAHARKLGLVESADGGTLFLDEIGDMEPGLQAKVLKLLEERTVRRVGSLREQRVNVRIITATHRPLEELVSEGKFRSDLYYRLRIVQFRVPPLRERGADILLLAQHYLVVHAQRYGKSDIRLSEEAERVLLAHRWPGNVRELRNVMEQAVLMSSSATIEPADLNLLPETPRAAAREAQARAEANVPDMDLRASERELLLRALTQSAWNVSEAARLLGVSRDTLRYRIAKYKLAQPH